MKGLFEDCRSHTSVFTTPHLAVAKQSDRKGAARINRFVYYTKAGQPSNYMCLAWPCRIELDASREIIRRMKLGGPVPVRYIWAIDAPGWSGGELVHELLFGIRQRLGPLSFDLIDQQAGSGVKSNHLIDGRRLKLDATGCWINGRRVQVDDLVSARVRERLSLSTIDDTWNMLVADSAISAAVSPTTFQSSLLFHDAVKSAELKS